MLEKVISVVAAAIVPSLGLLLQASRRNRLQRRIDDYLALADKLAEHDPDSATECRRLASETIRPLLRRDERALQRRVDPSAVIAVLFLTIPSLAVFVWTFSWTSGWKWPVRIFAAAWTVLWGSVGITQIWKERTDEAAVAPHDG